MTTPAALDDRRSPTPLVPVLSYAVLTAAYVVMNRDTPQPDASGGEVLAYAQTHGTSIVLGSALLAVAAAALVWAASALLGRTPGGTRSWGLGSGVLAGAALVVSGVFAFLGGRLPADGDPGEARDLADLSFLAGGPAFAATAGLLIAAVASTRRLPRGLRVTGYVLAAAGLLSLLTPTVAAFGYLLPLVRFGGLIWLVLAAVSVQRGGAAVKSYTAKSATPR
ncbi:DUF4386 domain-containing protein [Streptomyces sp. Da 82-17]|uniref:DUF4386 domain-containing protein n=1 Tax=Streptomyces sp. Da 82-17 TaxID=3377116 RepID=UPI0038D4636F